VLCAQAGQELSRVVGLIEGLQAKPAASSAQPGELPADFDQQLKDLLGLLEDYDSAAEDRLFDILAQVQGSDVEGSLKALQKPIGQYDLEAAAEALRGIIDALAHRDAQDD
jgi:hypothetical protein